MQLMLRRHSLLWRLVILVVAFCLSLIGATHYLSARIDHYIAHLPERSLAQLRGYAAEANTALAAGPQALAAWQRERQALSPELWVVVDAAHQPLPGQRLSAQQHERLSFVRDYDGLMSMRGDGRPMIQVPLPHAEGYLVLRLPVELAPWGQRALLNALVLYLLPAVLSVLFGGLLYWLLISPLEQLRRQANALRANPLEALLPESMARRRDELGELGRSLEYLTQRLRNSVAQQRQLLCDLSHELRTPLSRLRVASESDLPLADMHERLERETNLMQSLVDNTLELAWLDSEQPRLECEPVDVAALWDLLREDALFESGWAPERIGSSAMLPPGCVVRGNLNGLAQAMENVLRNAIRHSPPQGQVCLSAQREQRHWCLSIVDQGPGVPDSELEVIFRPFARFCEARPGGSGFGLGLAIAEGMLKLQGADIWAENAQPGLRVNIRLPAV
ncbi:MAG: ATP-binding protein [Halopseudomonas sp.]|uniref:HAMP domain-containing sensor histidine kinase n=1 Tax=Halopseudomonas sp. TaxID=2901191 RepID=UPI003001052D